SLKTEMVVSANFREWRHIFRLRTSTRAHPQMREVTIPLLREVQAIPNLGLLFEDIHVTEAP
ncbi:MAG: FAD-dependent thymidylate synthase, partial [Candidatus Neomarinimicrobiota bacterium]